MNEPRRAINELCGYAPQSPVTNFPKDAMNDDKPRPPKYPFVIRDKSGPLSLAKYGELGITGFRTKQQAEDAKRELEADTTSDWGELTIDRMPHSEEMFIPE